MAGHLPVLKKKEQAPPSFPQLETLPFSTPLATIYQQCSDMLHPTTIDTSGTFVPTIGCGHIWPHTACSVGWWLMAGAGLF
jgi:hypothetical protein